MSPPKLAIDLVGLFRETVAALHPGPLVREYLLASPLLSDRSVPITLLALGKAAVPMALATKELLGERVVDEVVVAPNLPAGAPATWIASTHPAISAASLAAGRALLRAASDARGEILALISGGGSALAALPAPGLSLEEKSDLVSKVYAAGATIDELNVVRKHLSAIKGGRLALAASVPVTTLMLSDVVGDAHGTIASGPTVPDPSSYADAVEIVQSLLGSEAQSPAIEHLRQGALGQREDTPSVLASGEQVLLAGIAALTAQAEVLAHAKGIATHRCLEPLEGNIEAMAAVVLAAGDQAGLWVGGGEASIQLPENPGIGGRAQQLALHLAVAIEGRSNLQILVAGSDGIDGNSDAAGAMVDGSTCEQLRELAMDPEHYLRCCDAGTALARIGATILTGPTGVNHADLILVSRTE